MDLPSAKILRLEPDDVILIELEEEPDMETMYSLSREIKETFGEDRKVLITAAGTITVLRPVGP